jgi:hypothetical protein
VVNTWMATRMYQERQVSPGANREKRSNLRGSIVGIAMNMATIRVIVPKRRRCMEPKCQKSKKMRMRKGLQVLDPDKMGCKYSIPPKGAMVRLDQEWYYMATRIMNVQIVRFFSGKIERVCWQYVPYN